MIRRLFVLTWAVATLLVAGITTMAAPATASAVTYAACPAIYPRPAYCDNHYPREYSTVPVSYKGWVYLNLNHCPQGMACAAVYRDSASAWSWTGSAWRQTTIRGGWVYVYPYTGSWRWAWTQQSGWVAISGHRFEYRGY